MVPVTAPADMPTIQKGPALEDLTHSQNIKLCEDILDEVCDTIVSCSEGGSHGPSFDLTTCFSPTCSLSGLDPLLVLATAIVGLLRIEYSVWSTFQQAYQLIEYLLQAGLLLYYTENQTSCQ